MRSRAVVLCCCLLVTASAATAGNLLFVSDDGSDNNIPAALTADGHNVTVSTSRDALLGDLSGFAAVFWSASDDGEDDLTAVINNLVNYVNAGGYVFVTGGDSVAAPVNPDLVGFVGGSGGYDGGYFFTAVINEVNSLTTGVVDIRGEVPYANGNIGDSDSLCGPLLSGTIGISMTDTTSCGGQPGYAWTLRQLGSGQIAWLTSSNFDNDSDEPNWEDTTTFPGDGVYNGALRNFAYNASLAAAPAIPTLDEWGMLVLSLLLLTSAVLVLRRYRETRVAFRS